MHGLIFETSICYWQDQPGSPPLSASAAAAGACGGRRARVRADEGGDPRGPPPHLVPGRERSGPAGRARQPASAFPRPGDRGTRVGRFRESVLPGSPAPAPEPGMASTIPAAEAAGPVFERLGRTGRLDLARLFLMRYTAAAAAAGPSRPRGGGGGGGAGTPATAFGANPRFEGTVRRELGSRPAGEGPSMAGHGFLSVGRSELLARFRRKNAAGRARRGAGSVREAPRAVAPEGRPIPGSPRPAPEELRRGRRAFRRRRDFRRLWRPIGGGVCPQNVPVDVPCAQANASQLRFRELTDVHAFTNVLSKSCRRALASTPAKEDNLDVPSKDRGVVINRLRGPGTRGAPPRNPPTINPSAAPAPRTPVTENVWTNP